MSAMNLWDDGARMGSEDRKMLQYSRRLLLAVATNLDDARQKVLRDVGPDDVDSWYGIAVFLAQDMVHLLDGHYLVATNDVQVRERTIACIQHMLAAVLDE